MKNTTKILLPLISEGVKKGMITKWHVKVGDKVVNGDVLYEFDTDKATIEIPSEKTGYIKNIFVKENQEITVGTPVCEIDTIILDELFSKTKKDFQLISDQMNQISLNLNLREEIIYTLGLSDNVSNEDIINEIKKLKSTTT